MSTFYAVEQTIRQILWTLCILLKLARQLLHFITHTPNPR